MLESDFSRDTEFTKLLSHRRNVNLTLAALELARDADPQLDFHETLSWIEARSRELAVRTAQTSNERDVVQKLVELLAQRHDLRGDMEAFNRPEASYLNHVVKTKRGIPISLCVLYMAVAQPAGLPLEGVGAPMQFLVRCQSPQGPLFVDPFRGGKIMSFHESVEWLQELTGMSSDQIVPTLGPATARSIVVRMLTNLKLLHMRCEDWSSALPVQQRLAALDPTSYEQRRDLAVTALKAGHPGSALDLLRRCRKACPQNEAAVLDEHIRNAERVLAQWN